MFDKSRFGIDTGHNELNTSVPGCGRLIFSSTDHLNKYQNKKIESSSSVSNNVYVREVQSLVVSKVPEIEVNQYVTQEVQDGNKQQPCPALADTSCTSISTKSIKKKLFVITSNVKN